jgi:hypothetical protein
VSGYNWRNALGDFAATSGVLAGFTLTFIVFILGWSVANTKFVNGVTWGEIGVLLNGIASVLFVTASEFLLSSKSYDAWSLPEKYESFLKKGFKKKRINWNAIRNDNLQKCLKYQGWGRTCFNFGIFLMFFSFFFVIGNYNLTIAVLISGLGIGIELTQTLMAHK